MKALSIAAAAGGVLGLCLLTVPSANAAQQPLRTWGPQCGPVQQADINFTGTMCITLNGTFNGWGDATVTFTNTTSSPVSVELGWYSFNDGGTSQDAPKTVAPGATETADFSQINVYYDEYEPTVQVWGNGGVIGSAAGTPVVVDGP